MDIENFLMAFDNFSYYGVVMNPEKKMLIYNSLIVLKNDAHFKEIRFWGTVNGTTSDYYIAYGFEKDALYGRVYYYSINGLEWLLLPQPTDTDFKLASACISRFQGDPGFAAITDDDRTETEERTTEDPIKSEGKLKEEDRLAVTVTLINEEVFVVPRGALFKRPDGLVTINNVFTGITHMEADELRSYLHYRAPRLKWNTNLLTRKDYNYAVDFLDTIDADKPSNQWIMQQVNGGKTVYLQNLSWPGYIFYHTVGTPHFASIYKGDGKKNVDIPFML